MPKITDHAAHFDEEEFVKLGGSRVTVDLAKLTNDRVVKAIKSVTQIAPDELTLLAVHSAGVVSATVEHYIYLCCKDETLYDPMVVLTALFDGIRHELDEIKTEMSKPEENGKSIFANMVAVSKAQRKGRK